MIAADLWRLLARACDRPVDGSVGVRLAERNRTLAKSAGAELAALLLDTPGASPGRRAGGLDAHDPGRAGPSRTQMLHVARDDARMARLIEALRFFAPALEVVRSPGLGLPAL